ncbi:MAG: dephospho-CoA kinase [Bdellovibrionales bacterium]|nr:dephospho-CoA kinase [Bdellovibrionales bacterium]
MTGIQVPPNLPPLVGLTGGIGCGKSAVSKAFEAKGIPVIDADILAREIVAPGAPALLDIATQFGAQFVADDGTLNRKALGELVFSDAQKRKQLESITHPRIRNRYAEILAQIAKDERSKAPFVLYVVPLLFESGFDYQELSLTAVVFAPEHIAIERIMQRDNCDEALAKKKVASQIPIQNKCAKASVIIDNSGSLEALPQIVDKAYQEILGLLP